MEEFQKNKRKIITILNIYDNKRVDDLTKSLSVNNSNYYMNHLYYWLSEEDMLTQQLIKKYANCSDGTKQDLLVVKALLANLEKPIESLNEFPILKKAYLGQKI